MEVTVEIIATYPINSLHDLYDVFLHMQGLGFAFASDKKGKSFNTIYVYADKGDEPEESNCEAVLKCETLSDGSKAYNLFIR